MFNAAFPVRAIEFTQYDGKRRRQLWLRALHYFIVSSDTAARQMPSKGKNNTRLYENTLNDWKRLSELIVNARLFGLVSEDAMWDNKNDFIQEPENRSFVSLSSINIEINSDMDFHCHINRMKDFAQYLADINVQPEYTPSRFANQEYEIIVVTEKLTMKESILPICRQYGANCLVLKGQSSFTRVQEICKKARNANLPILLLGIYDLDCAGWDMGPSFMYRVNQTYPKSDSPHKYIRVGLNKDQVEKYHLPPSFEPDDKDYPEAQVKRFIEESGSTTFTELDALENSVMAALLEEQLKKYAKLEDDIEEEREFKESIEDKIDDLKGNYDFEQYKQKYDRYFEKYGKFRLNAVRFKEILSAQFEHLHEKIQSIEDSIREDLEPELNILSDSDISDKESPSVNNDKNDSEGNEDEN